MSKNRYEEAPESVYEVMREVKKEYFPELKNASIKMLYDTKKRTSSGMIVLGRIMKPNDLINLFTKKEALLAGGHEGYDYIVALDKVCWENLAKIDQVRIIRHELRHTYFDIDAEDNPYKLMGHTFSDFHEEVELNAVDPRWRERIGSLTSEIYDQQKEESRNSKANKRNKRHV